MTNESASLPFCLWELFSLGTDIYEAIKNKKILPKANKKTPNPHISIIADVFLHIEYFLQFYFTGDPAFGN